MTRLHRHGLCFRHRDARRLNCAATHDEADPVTGLVSELSKGGQRSLTVVRLPLSGLILPRLIRYSIVRLGLEQERTHPNRS